MIVLVAYLVSVNCCVLWPTDTDVCDEW